MECRFRETRGGLGCAQDPSPSRKSAAASIEGSKREDGWAFINVQGMRNKQGELRDLLKGQKISVLGLAETWLLPGEEVCVEGYKWVGAARENSVGRAGVGMFVCDTYTVVEEEVEAIGTGVEAVWARISGEGLKETLLGVVYISPHTRGEMLVGKGDRLVDVVLDKQQEGLEVLIMGDFNAHFDESKVALDVRASLVESLSRVANLTVMNWEPEVAGKWTWGCEQKQSVLDYVLMSAWWVDRTSRFCIDDEGFLDIGSDHNVLLWHAVPERGREEPVREKRKRKYKEWKWKTGGKVDWERYRLKVEEKMDLFAKDMTSDTSSGWTARGRYKVFQSYLNEAASESLGKRFCGSGSRENKGWWDDEVKQAVKLRREASRTHRFYKKLSINFPEAISQEVVKSKWDEYLHLKHEARDLVKEKMEKEREDILKEMKKCGGFNSGFFWHRAKAKKGKCLTKLRDESGAVMTEERIVADIARSHFESLGRGGWEAGAEEIADREGSGYVPKELDGEVAAELDRAPTYEEVVKAIKRLKKGKGVGGDKVSAEMIVNGGEMLWGNLHTLLVKCWEEEFVPEEWTEGIIVPLYKEGDECDVGNYRGITLGSHIGKVFCSILKERLYQAVDGVIIGEAQGGFRKNRQTVDHLFVVSGISQLRRIEGKKTWLAFLDLKKAYDSVWREGLWEKLEAYGVKGKFVRMCQELYSRVSARVRVGQSMSETFEIGCGLRQGCILSPCLFSLFIMDLAGELESRGLGVHVKGQWMGSCLFADDIVLIGGSAQELQLMLDVAAGFAKRWHLRFNPKKCGVLVVGQKKREKRWRLGNDRLKEVDEYKYLGMWMNRQATGHTHVEHLLEKAASLHGLARKAKFWRGGEDVEAGIVMWEAACSPKLNYGSEVWACSSKREEDRLEQVQERGGRVILGVSWRFPGVVVRGDLGWAKLRTDRHKRALGYVGRLRGMEDFRWPRIVWEALAVADKKGKGSWVDYLESLKDIYGLGEEWINEDWSERRWREVVRKAVLEEAGREWRGEVASRVDLGSYGEVQEELVRAHYLKGFKGGDVVREEIKKRCEWGCHWQ